MMKHTIELKFPKLFGKKKSEKVESVHTEIDVAEEVKEIPVPVLVAGVAVVSMTAGYLVGFKRGVEKSGVTIIK